MRSSLVGVGGRFRFPGGAALVSSVSNSMFRLDTRGLFSSHADHVFSRHARARIRRLPRRPAAGCDLDISWKGAGAVRNIITNVDTSDQIAIHRQHATAVDLAVEG